MIDFKNADFSELTTIEIAILLQLFDEKDPVLLECIEKLEKDLPSYFKPVVIFSRSKGFYSYNNNLKAYDPRISGLSYSSSLPSSILETQKSSYSEQLNILIESYKKETKALQVQKSLLAQQEERLREEARKEKNAQEEKLKKEKADQIKEKVSNWINAHGSDALKLALELNLVSECSTMLEREYVIHIDEHLTIIDRNDYRIYEDNDLPLDVLYTLKEYRDKNFKCYPVYVGKDIGIEVVIPSLGEDNIYTLVDFVKCH